ncbi:serpin family protein [Geomesophilobacter sediminis]|uniref:Serpin family protein n=1 Tax=Geomesophilobacter sediminis TaxID=2798584 RepID=A0A8J7JEB6_9BACT|nr:serpin family protein [Geomesophilobacter sediminis]MBJ6725888.1 serpin family protein [Geomesophilobacter sediminis]
MATRFLGILVVMTLLAGGTVPAAFARNPGNGNSGTAPQAAAKNGAAVAEMAAGNTAFALDLYAALKPRKGNLFFSPYSISSVMALLYGGARGSTAQEIARTLHFDLGPQRTHPAFAELNSHLDQLQRKGNVQLRTANSLWPRQGYALLPDYLALAKRDYQAALFPVKYGGPDAPHRINSWVSQKTEGKIDRIVPPDLDAATVMVVVNAIYFKGKWARQFDPKHTRPAPFALLDGGKKSVMLMNRTGRYRYREFAGGKLLELPYQGNDLSMIVILPNDPEEFAAAESQLTRKNLDLWLGNMMEQRVDVYLPKFQMVWGTQDLRRPLESLGLRLLFTGGADLSGMNGRRDLYVSELYHKAFVEVNEEGTEAAAATAGALRMAAVAPSRTVTFRADHPFLFLIRDHQTGSVLFIGRVVEP